MKRLIVTTVMVCTTAVALQAQGPAARRPGPAEDPAQFLLAHTGELALTDAQVTRLAAIARRSAERRQSLRAQMDSMRPERMTGRPGARPDSAARERARQRLDQMRPAMDRLRAQSQADRRDAIAVLTPDQQAQAWERIASGGRGQRGGMRRGGGAAPGPGFNGPPRPGPRRR